MTAARPLRLLHTSDWHLGATLHGVSRDADHARFLAWLLEQVAEQAADVLIVAGDVFDHAQPSAEAQALYYRFLADAARTDLAAVIVVGGNHDSASRLDAPRQVLGALDVHVIGGLHPTQAHWSRCLVPVRRDGALIGVVAAVPYVHEYRLGVRATAGDRASIRDWLTAALGEVYTHLADEATERWPGVPLVATGHLSATGVEEADGASPIHLMASIGALPASVFDTRFDYVALGHIHRSFQVEQRAIWYCGSPIPLRLGEETERRRILRADVTPGAADVVPIEVPVLRELIRMKGTSDAVASALAEVHSDAPLPALVYADVDVDDYEPALLARLERILGGRVDDPAARPRLVSVRQRRADADDGPDSTGGVTRAPAPRLGDLDPEDVFERLCAARGETPDVRLLTAFRSLLTPDEQRARDAKEAVQGALLLGSRRRGD